MRCFTYFHGELHNGIKTTTSRKEKRLVFLGAKGMGCRRELVFFDRKKEDHPEVDDDGIIKLAYPAKRSFVDRDRKEVKKVILKRAYPSATKILLRINTSTSSTFRINGRWQIINGWPTTWVEAHGFQRGQTWSDDLVVMDDQDVILVFPAGCNRDDRRVVYNLRGEIGCIPEQGYRKVLDEIKERQALSDQPTYDHSEIIVPPVINETKNKKSHSDENPVEKVEVKTTMDSSSEKENSEKVIVETHENGKAYEDNSSGDTETVIHEEPVLKSEKIEAEV